MEIQEFDKRSLDNLRASINSALETVKEEYNLDSIKVGGINYSPYECTCKVEVKATPSDKASEEKAALEAQKCRVLGLAEDTIGREFESNGHIYVVDHIDLNKRKYPVIAKQLGTDKMYKFTEDTIIRKLQSNKVS